MRRIPTRSRNNLYQNVSKRVLKKEITPKQGAPASRELPTSRPHNWTLRIIQEPLPKQIQDFAIPKSLIDKILSKEYQTDRTFTATFENDLIHTVNDQKLRNHGIKELIGVGTSNFYGSTYNRKKNINAAIEKFNGLVIPKGETFSFNGTLQSVLPEDGFVYEKVIIGENDEYRLGGGVCQVSTTVYRSAFNTGLPMDVRRGHSRKVSYYWPHGFDATIYLGQQDLKFTNDTPGDVMLQFVIEGNNLIVLTYGTKDRKVDSTQHGGWNLAYWWKRLVQKDGAEPKEETYRTYYKPDKKEEFVEE